MTTIFSFSFLMIFVLGLSLWWETRKRKSYGDRPRLLFGSLVVFAAAGFLSLILVIFRNTDAVVLYQLFLLVSVPLYALSSFLLEYSVHRQRIMDSDLVSEFNRTFRIVIIIVALMGLVGAGGAVLMIVLSDTAESMISILGTVQLGLLLAWAAYTYLAVFSFQEGVLRKKQYPTILTLATILVAAILFNIRFPWDPNLNLPVLALLVLNLGYGYRAMEEYFFYSAHHLNNVLAQQEAGERRKTDLINRIIVSTKAEEREVLHSLISDTLQAIQDAHFFPQHKITGFALYRKRGDRFVVDDESSIHGFTVPLFELMSVKKQSKQQLDKYLMDTVYSESKIRAASPAELTDFGQKMLREMLDTKQKVVLDKIPDNYRGLQQFICLYPILNNEEVSGFMVLYKDAFHKLLIHEDNGIRTLAGYLNTVFSIMNGKDVQEEKNRLEGEINIARQIQTSIVPKTLELPGYQVAAAMVTASEVGGDAYDLRHEEDGTYVFIGDVSGHGLPAGIMALISLSAFHGAIETAKLFGRNVEPADLYDITNRVLCLVNRDRIGSDKFMTGNTFLVKDNTFVHAGTHEIALHYRKAENSVVQLEACVDKTAFLGLSELVQSGQSTGSFTLAPGDYLVLYSDGVIEAKNSRDEQFGIPRLANLVSEHARRGASPDDVVSGVLQEIQSFAADGDMRKHGGNLADDFSMVVFRKE